MNNIDKLLPSRPINPIDHCIARAYSIGDLVQTSVDIVYECVITSLNDDPLSSHRWRVWKKRYYKAFDVNNKKDIFYVRR